MQPTNNYRPTSPQPVPQQDSGKRNREEGNIRELEERIETATKKRKLIQDAAAPIQENTVTKELSPANEGIADQIESIKGGNPVFAAVSLTNAAKPLSLQDEVLLFLDEEIRSQSSRDAETFKIQSKEEVLSFLSLMKTMALNNLLGEVVSHGEFQGTSIPWFLARRLQWALLAKMTQNKIGMDFNASPTSGPFQGISIFLWAAIGREWSLINCLLKNKIQININTTLNFGSLAGVNGLYLIAYYGQWNIVKAILLDYPHANVNCFASQSIQKQNLIAKATLVHLAALANKWDIVKIALERGHVCHADAVLESGQFAGANLLVLAALNQQWDCFQTILKNYPGQNINAAVLNGLNAGKTALCFVGFYKRWDLFSEILDLYPHASVSASPTQGINKGRTPLLMAAEAGQWNLVAKALLFQRTADVDACHEQGTQKEANPFWYAVNAAQWPIALDMLTIKPRLKLEREDKLSLPINLALAHRYYGFVKLLLILGAKDPPPDVAIQETGNNPQQPQLSVLNIISGMRQGLVPTRSKIYDTLYNTWNQPENATFAWIRGAQDIRAQIACEILIAEHPDIPVFPGLPAIVEEWANMDAERNRAAKERTAVLAYRQYRWNNGIFEGPTSKVIKDIRQLIVESMDEVGKTYPFQCTKEVRRQIVKSIGEEQKNPPRITRSFVQRAIMGVVSPKSPRHS